MKKSDVSTNEEISFPQMKKPQMKKNKIKDSTNEEIVIKHMKVWRNAWNDTKCGMYDKCGMLSTKIVLP